MENQTSFRTHNSKTWLCSLLSYFMNIKTIDDNIELLRVSLCSQPNFYPYKLFHFLDKNAKEFLLLNDFIKFLQEMRIPFEEKYLRIFIHNFDKDGDFSLNVKEFLGIILPKKNNSFAKNISTKIKNDNIDDIISLNTKNIFGKIICEELELVKNCIMTAKSCKESIGFTLYEAFLLIAGNNKYICEKSLFDFLQKNNICINNNEIHQLMFRLDADNDGKISFDEFKEIFFPIKEEEIKYKIKNNDNIKIDFNNCDYLRNNILKKEKYTEKIEENKNDNLVDFTFAQKSKVSPKISIKTNFDYKKRLDKLMNYKYDDDLVQNKENSPSNTDININTNNDQNGSLYKRTKYIMENKNLNLFKTKNPPKIVIREQFPVICPESKTNETNIQKEKKYKFEYSRNPLIIKRNVEQNSYSLYSPKRIKTQKTSGYQSPKTKHTKSPLHYDYSTYSDEDGDEYFKQKKLNDNKNCYTDKRVKNINENKLTKIFGGIDYKKEFKNNLEKMFLEDEQQDNKRKIDIVNIKNELNNRKFNFIYNDTEGNDIKLKNFDDIKRKNFKNENFI